MPELANFEHLSNWVTEGNIAERTQYCSAWPRLQYALNTSAGAAGGRVPGPARPPPLARLQATRPPQPPNWPPRYLANNASPRRATATYHRTIPLPPTWSPHTRQGRSRSPPVIAIFIGDAHKYAGQVISSAKWMAEARRWLRPAGLTRNHLHQKLGRGGTPPSPGVIIKNKRIQSHSASWPPPSFVLLLCEKCNDWQFKWNRKRLKT